MEKFQKEITFISKVAKETGEGKGIEWVEEEVTKQATFKELNRTDKDQHLLHGKILTLSVNSSDDDDEGKKKINVDSDGVIHLSKKAINCLLIPDENFTAADKKDFLSDSIAVINFGLWLIAEKVSPFFSKFKVT